jgi:transketolase
LKGFNSTFLIFADYMKPCIRIACIQNLPVIFAFSHDSIGVGFDGKSHQLVEQLTML